MNNSIEFEGEIKERLYSYSISDRSFKIPTPTYIGMFAGATKPKPFQRKRPNLSRLPPGKLPSLQEMRSIATELHKGSYRPCSSGSSRRMDLALQHIYEVIFYVIYLNVILINFYLDSILGMQYL